MVQSPNLGLPNQVPVLTQEIYYVGIYHLHGTTKYDRTKRKEEETTKEEEEEEKDLHETWRRAVRSDRA